MEAGSKGTLSTGKMAALAAGLSVGAATLGYIVYRSVSSHTPELADPESSRMTVSLEVYRNISRYQAGFLDLVSQQSGAQVRVQSEGGDPGSQQAVCLQLRGSAEQVLRARCAVDKLASDCEPTCHAMEVPYSAFGRIIGRGGETLKFISRTTGAKVNCPRERGRGLEEKGQVSITGTRLEVRKAKEMIREKVLEDQTVRMRISQASTRRQKRRPHDPEVTEAEPPPEPSQPPCPAQGEGLVLANGPAGEPVGAGDTECKTLNGDATQEEEEDVVSPDSLSDVSKFEIPSPDLSFQPDEHLEVYVSASENPHHFWIQILGVRSLQLDKLTQEMSRFYSNETLPEQRVEALVVGDIVAAPYRDHGTWNRARVLCVLGGPSGLVDLYYVDYGDNGELPRDSLRSMRSDFLSLPFQAIECSLADVSPAGEVWSEAAMDDFDRLTYCSEWRPLLAKLCSYSHSEVSSWPSVKLYDKSQGKAGDLGEELIALGHAVLCQDMGNGHGDHDEAGSLQRMLDDVTGATSELSLSCISLSATPSQGGERVSGLQTPSSFSSQRSPEVQRADVDDSPSPGLGPSFFHSTPAPRALLGLDSSIVDSPGPQPLPLSPDQRAPDPRCHTFHRTPSLYAEPVLSLTYTLPVSPLPSASSLSLSASSLSPSASSPSASSHSAFSFSLSASSLSPSASSHSASSHSASSPSASSLSHSVSSASASSLSPSASSAFSPSASTSSSGPRKANPSMASVTLSDDVFLEPASSEHNSSPPFWSSGAGHVDQSSSGGRSSTSEGVLSVGSSFSSSPSQEICGLGKGGAGVGGGGGGGGVEVLSGDSSHSGGSASSSDVIYVGTTELPEGDSRERRDESRKNGRRAQPPRQEAELGDQTSRKSPGGERRLPESSPDGEVASISGSVDDVLEDEMT